MSIVYQQHFTNSFQESSEASVNVVIYDEMLYKIADISYKHIHKFLNQQKKYITANGLYKKAIQMGLDTGSLAIQGLNYLIKNFIARHALKHTSKQTSKHLPKHN
ncbi:hypothetical protein C2G38_2160512 [Gigaspora rosea]|uniref:Uncharacterized protein n=1 Tax=Gigaspora rosea TaxID=44941 RepID=A0A397VY35_9GLOM|nr:hypothetical protein C2G38_2160512 [Gigaspora rosea]